MSVNVVDAISVVNKEYVLGGLVLLLFLFLVTLVLLHLFLPHPSLPVCVRVALILNIILYIVFSFHFLPSSFLHCWLHLATTLRTVCDSIV